MNWFKSIFEKDKEEERTPKIIAELVNSLQSGNTTMLEKTLNKSINCPDCGKSFRLIDNVDSSYRRIACPYCPDFFMQW